MLTRKTVLVASALLLSSTLGSVAYAAELGAESIVDEQAASQHALQDQQAYRAYHQNFKLQHVQAPAPMGQLPHHN